MLPSVKSMSERMMKAGVSPQVIAWLVKKLDYRAGRSMAPEGIVTELSLIINSYPGGPDNRTREHTWDSVEVIVKALIDNRAGRRAALRHVALIKQTS